MHVKLASELAPCQDTTNVKNLCTVIISLFNTFCSQFSPLAQNKQHVKQIVNFKPPLKGKQPLLDPACPYYLKGLVRKVFINKLQVSYRNTLSYQITIKQLDIDQVFLYSRSLALRSLKDIASYLSLFKHTNITRDAIRPYIVEGDITQLLDINLYTLPNNNLRCKFYYTCYYFLIHIINTINLTPYKKGIHTRKVMLHFILRCNYQLACLFRLNNKIARNLPNLTHFSIKQTFLPSAKALYNYAANNQ